MRWFTTSLQDLSARERWETMLIREPGYPAIEIRHWYYKTDSRNCRYSGSRTSAISTPVKLPDRRPGDIANRYPVVEIIPGH